MVEVKKAISDESLVEVFRLSLVEWVNHTMFRRWKIIF